ACREQCNQGSTQLCPPGSAPAQHTTNEEPLVRSQSKIDAEAKFHQSVENSLLMGNCFCVGFVCRDFTPTWLGDKRFFTGFGKPACVLPSGLLPAAGKPWKSVLPVTVAGQRLTGAPRAKPSKKSFGPMVCPQSVRAFS